MLLNNEWKAAGLVNGATGTIHKIIYAPDSKPPDLPRYCYIAGFFFANSKKVILFFPF